MAKPAVKLMTRLRMANKIFPVRNNSTVSKLKVEKVLKPPQKPVIIKNFNKGFTFVLSAKIKTVTAKIIQLIILEQKVASGKLVFIRVTNASETP